MSVTTDVHTEEISDIFSSQCATSEKGDIHSNATLDSLHSCNSWYMCHSCFRYMECSTWNHIILQIFNLLFKSHNIS